MLARRMDVNSPGSKASGFFAANIFLTEKESLSKTITLQLQPLLRKTKTNLTFHFQTKLYEKTTLSLDLVDPPFFTWML